MSALHHLALTAADPSRSVPFYDRMLAPLGYRRTHADAALAVWEGPAPEILLYTARPEHAGRRHVLYAPGLHHLAFRVADRAAVDRLHGEALALGAAVLDPPAEYPHYAPGYYAVFLCDPDGLKLEFAHIPDAA